VTLCGEVAVRDRSIVPGTLTNRDKRLSVLRE